MKTCVTCKFHGRQPTVIGQDQFGKDVHQMADVCMHDTTRDPVNGNPMPCAQARVNPNLNTFCGLSGKLWQAKEQEEKKPVEGNVIHLK